MTIRYLLMVRCASLVMMKAAIDITAKRSWIFNSNFCLPQMIMPGVNAETINLTPNIGARICTYFPETSQPLPKNQPNSGGANQIIPMTIGIATATKNKLVLRKAILNCFV